MTVENPRLQTDKIYAPSVIAPTYPDVICVVGCPRSGTTFLQYVLAYGMDTSGNAEVKFIVDIYRQLQPSAIWHGVIT